MKEDSAIVLLHGSANGSYSWGRVRNALIAAGKNVFAPDMLGYGSSRPPGPAYGIEEEVAHLKQAVEGQGIGRFHLVAHSLGSMFGLHLRRALGERVTRLTLIDPVVVSVLREQGEAAGYAEMEAQYQGFMGEAEPTSAARFFVEHWSGRGTWSAIGDRARAVIVSLVPRLRLEMQITRSDPTGLAFFAEAPPPTEILMGEKTLVAPRATARQLARAFHAASVVVPEAAHMIPLTHPEAVVRAVLGEGTP
ncbi:alpha/beta fold hydrolase [Stigmatella aurantiaca]|uniref:Hydroxymuconic semialdehyde hydrolase n=1 Tax=Stigmatella aurantiaca (strain DW4/3-1) TaxID=378806 RepID=Q097I4_STIAD|nr:alpha/beta fold hydrolase [Stigmatella aurantiaca]ADO69885.1 Hydroxymuconic semialdehyde hydrolase [Stigmatella aurantiaca DW4/3-1]EAU67903.1 hydroxymuconic semialdehyde hydrolase, putative [Stigmatella aurantiaca DW4/3-1]